VQGLREGERHGFVYENVSDVKCTVVVHKVHE
jgi:hypothetical protein